MAPPLKKRMHSITEEHYTALKKDAQRYKFFFEENPTLNVVIGKDFLIKDINNAFAKALFYTKKDVIGKKFSSFLIPEQRKAVGELLRREFKEKIGVEAHVKIVDKRKKVHDIHFIETPKSAIFQDEKGHPYLFTTGVDITQQKKIQQELKEQKEFSEKIIQTANAIIVGLDKNHVVTLFNKGAEDATGYKAKEVIGKDWFKLFFEKKQLAEMNKVFAHSWKTKLVQRHTNPILTKDGKEIIVAWQNSRIINIETNKKIIISIGEDITEKNKLSNELQKQKKELEMFVQSSGLPFCTYDKKGNILQLNQSAAKKMNGEIKDFLNKNILDLWPKQDAEEYLKRIKKCFKEKKEFELVDKISLSQGNKWFISTYKPIKNSAGNIYAVQIVSADITEIKEAETKLKESERKLQSTHKILLKSQEIANFGTWEYDILKKVSYWSPEMYNIFDISRDKSPIPYAKHKKFFSKEEWILFDNAVKKAATKGERYDLQLQLNTSKKIKFIRTICEPIKEKGKIIKLVGVCQDITRMRKAEDNIIKEENKFRSLFEQAAVGVARLSTKGEWLEVNEKLCTIVGYTKNELLKKTFQNITHPDDLEKDLSYVKKMLAGKIKNYHMEKRYFKKDKSIIWINLTVSLVRDKANKPEYFISIIEDITEKKEAEKALKKSRQELINVLDATPFPVAIADLQNENISYWSESAKIIFGHAPSSVQEWYEKAYPDKKYRDEVIKRWKGHIKEALKTKKTVNGGEYNVTCADGSIKICEIHVRTTDKNMIVTLNDITVRKEAEESLLRKTSFESLLNEISMLLINSPLSQLASNFDRALENINSFYGFDRTYIFSVEGNIISNIHEYCAKGVKSEIKNLQYMDASKELPWFFNEIKKLKPFVLEDVEKLPKKASLEKKHFKKQNIKSLLTTPIILDNSLDGFLGIDIVDSKKELDSGIKSELQALSNLFSGFIQRQKAEDILKKSEFMLKKSQEIGLIGTWSFDIVNDVLEWTEQTYIIFGVKQGTPMNLKLVLATLHPDDKKYFGEQWSIALKTGQYDIEHRVLANGKVKWVREVAEIHFDNKGKAINALGIAQDITEKKKAEDELKESEKLFHDLFEKNSTIKLIIDPSEGYIVNANSAAEKFYGYSKQQFKKIKISDINTLSSAEIKKEMNLAVKENRKHFYFKHKLSSGEIRDVEVYSSPVTMGGVVLLNSIVIDSTDKIKAEKSVLKEKQLTDEMINSIPGVFYLISKQGKFVRWNKNFTAVTGRSDAQMAKISPLDLFAGEDKKNIAAAIKQVFAKGNTFVEASMITLKGEKIPYYFTGDRVVLGDETYLIGVGMDITEKKKTREALEESREILQRIINLLPARIFWKDKDLVYLGCNDLFAHDAGKKKAAELVGKDDFAMGWKKEAKAYRDDDTQVITSGKSKINFEEPQTTPSGDTIWLRTSKVLLTDVHGAVKGVLGTYSDITQEKTAQLLLEESENQYRSLFENMTNGFAFHQIVLDKDNKPVDYIFLEVNNSFEKLTGLKRKNIIGKRATEVLPGMEKDPVKWMQIYGDVALHNKNIEFENFSQPLNKWYKINAYSNKEGFFATVFEDITDKKKIHEETNRFNEFAIGRELKMVELKKKITELEKELKKKEKT